jgi:two-component system nitrogen regulation response regulator GlnG
MTKTDDTSTLTIGPLDALDSDSNRLPLIPALTLAWHPEISRVGHLAPLRDLIEQHEAVLQRDAPIFFKPGSTIGAPVDHRSLSRVPAVVLSSKNNGFELRRGPTDAEVLLDGLPFTEPRPLTAEDLARGLVLTVNRRFVFVLHAVRYPVARSPNMGLIGSGDPIEEIRRLILRVAPRNTPVLIRGRSGTGKELVARAIHAHSPRASGNFVDVNMGKLRPESAAAELFGYERGAFTGASEARPGMFRHAHQGTIFLDEIGNTSIEVQKDLLRTLQDHRVQSLGSVQPRAVDVRVLMATDADLEQLRADGQLLDSFYNRLNTAFTIELPPLHARREDIGVLFAHFLKEKLRAGGEESRLKDDWLKAPTVTQVLLANLGGNVRTLEGLAEALAVDGATNPHRVAMEYLAKERGATPSLRSADEPRQPRALEISREKLLAELERWRWNQSAVARSLHVSRQALGRRLEAEPDIRKIIDIPLPELLRAHEECGGDLDALSKRLGLPPSVLRRRLPPKA